MITMLLNGPYGVQECIPRILAANSSALIPCLLQSNESSWRAGLSIFTQRNLSLDGLFGLTSNQDALTFRQGWPDRVRHEGY